MTSDQPRYAYPAAQSALDLDPLFARLREHDPVAWVRMPDGTPAWLVTRYEDVRQVLVDPAFSRARAAPRVGGVSREVSLTELDPPEHTRIRRLLAKAFAPRRIEALRPRVQQITDKLLDAMAAGGPPADLVQALAFPLPVIVICELLGVPAEDRAMFASWADKFLATSPDQVNDAHEHLSAYLRDVIAERRVHPGNDLLSHLIRARDVEEVISEKGLVTLGVGLLVAGYETTANQLGNISYVLLTHPNHLDHLYRHPDVVPAAIEELLRLVPLGADPGMPRVATREVTLSGVRIPAGATVYAARPAANRDPAAFPVGDSIDFTPKDLPHLAFGLGAHYCLGARLARTELQSALGSTLRRFPHLQLAVPETELEWKTGHLTRGLHDLPVTWTPK